MRRQPNEIVRRKPGSCFLGAAEPSIVRLSGPADGALYEGDSRDNYMPCVICDNPDCIEWANVQIVDGEHKGGWLCHLSECEMEDWEVVE